MSTFISGAPNSGCSYFKPTKCKSDCRQLVLLAVAVRRVDKWPQAGGLLINRSSPHSSALAMSTHAPRTDIHLAISNLKSRQCVFIRVHTMAGGRCRYTGGQGTLRNFTANPRRPILCIQRGAEETLAPQTRSMSPLCTPCGGSTLPHHTASK